MSENNIVSLTAAYLSNEPHEGVVEFCRDLLDRAERGEIAGLAVCGVEGTAVFTDWISGRANCTQMVAAVNRLAFRVTMADVTDPSPNDIRPDAS